MRGWAQAALVLAVLVSGGAVASAHSAQFDQQAKPVTSITVGPSIYDFDLAKDAPAGACVTDVTLGQQHRVVAQGIVWAIQPSGVMVAGEWGPIDVTDRPGWRDAVPDDCDGVDFLKGGQNANQ